MTERREKVIRKTVDRNHADMRLDRYASKVTLLSKGDIQKNLRKKNIKLNGRRAQGSDRVREGDEVTFYIPDSLAREEQTAVKKEHKKLPFRVLFETDDILIVDKPAGILSQPDGSAKKDLVSIAENAGRVGAGVVTRLDMNTSGIVLMGKSRRSLMLLNEMSREGLFTKRYTALCEGDFRRDGRTVLYARKDERENRLILKREKRQGFIEVCAEFRAVRRLAGHTLLEVNLLTGKSHQIRAMLAFLGHPVAGDRKYGAVKCPLKRHFLHCSSLEIRTGEKYRELFSRNLSIRSELAGDLEKYLREAEK